MEVQLRAKSVYFYRSDYGTKGGYKEYENTWRSIWNHTNETSTGKVAITGVSIYGIDCIFAALMEMRPDSKL